MYAIQQSLYEEECNTESVVDQLVDFTFNGRTTHVEENRGIPFLWNEFWTARQRQSHRIHEISYRACFKAQLPEFFINRLTRQGDTVYDPFMGRGTTPVQAALMGRDALGVDINPLSIALTEPRLIPQNLSSIKIRLRGGLVIWWGSGSRFVGVLSPGNTQANLRSAPVAVDEGTNRGTRRR